MHRPKHIVEYAFVRAFAAVFQVLPHRVGLSIGFLLAAISHAVLRFRVREARARIRSVFGSGISERDVRRIAWLSWRNICFSVVEILSMPKLTAARARERMVDLGATDSYLGEEATRNGLVLAVPHSGNWDFAGVACHLQGYPMFFIARRQRNVLVDNYLNRMRGASGAETIHNDAHLLRSVIKGLRSGKILAILPDVRARTPALAIAFLGGTANIGAGMAMFARQVHCAIQPAGVFRVGWTRHQWQMFDPVFPDAALDKQEDWRRMTQAVMTSLDRFIREHPEHYFWYNKRWVLDPIEDTDAAVDDGDEASIALEKNAESSH